MKFLIAEANDFVGQPLSADMPRVGLAVAFYLAGRFAIDGGTMIYQLTERVILFLLQSATGQQASLVKAVAIFALWW